MIVLCITILIVLVASSEFTWKLLDDNWSYIVEIAALTVVSKLFDM